VCARIAVGVCYPSRISALRPVLRAIGLRAKKALGLRSQQVAIAPHKHMPIATYSNECIELDAGLSASTGGEHPNISQAQHRQRRLPVCASRLTAIEHPTTLRSTTEAPARLGHAG
jgi:hypothetical protein